MTILDLSYWQLRWRPWREWAFLPSRKDGPLQPRAGDDVLLRILPVEFLGNRTERLD